MKVMNLNYLHELKFNYKTVTPETDAKRSARDEMYHSVGAVGTTKVHVVVQWCCRVMLLINALWLRHRLALFCFGLPSS